MKRVLEVAFAMGLACAPGCGSQAPIDESTTGSSQSVAPHTQHLSTDFKECSARSRGDVQFSRDVEPILISGCSGEFCHGLTMTSASRAYAFLVNQPSFECDGQRALVAPGDPDHSYVMDKVLDRNLCSGHAMPRGLENRLSPDEVRTLADWICEGAPNN
jgi:hypothetical protein